MEFPITEQFKNFQEYIESSSIEDVLMIDSNFVEQTKEILNNKWEEMAKDMEMD